VQFLTSLFGGSGNMWLTAVFALGAVILLILIVTWLLKLLTGATGRAGRGRNRRLSLIDSLSIDPKRQLLIIRRDDVEHLILTGGPSDVVVERGIHVPQPPARTAPQAATARRPGPIVTQPAKPAAKPAAAAPTPAPVVKPAAAQKAEPARKPAEASNVSPLDRLREFGRPSQKRGNPPRHPGLIRPVTPLERPGHPQVAENSANPAHDSAKESGHGGTDEQGEFGGDTQQTKAEGRAGDVK
jgi:flagellar protein FliO/FliZ